MGVYVHGNEIDLLIRKKFMGTHILWMLGPYHRFALCVYSFSVLLHANIDRS